MVTSIQAKSAVLAQAAGRLAASQQQGPGPGAQQRVRPNDEEIVDAEFEEADSRRHRSAG